MHTTSSPQASSAPVILAVLLLIAVFAGLFYPAAPAGASWTAERMDRPYNDNGHPRSAIRVTGNCDDKLFCDIRYKIQYSYWGWRNSGNSDILVTPNVTSWTGKNAICNKSPGNYRGRMDMSIVNETQISVSTYFGAAGTAITVPATTTHWIRRSSPHAIGLEC